MEQLLLKRFALFESEQFSEVDTEDPVSARIEASQVNAKAEADARRLQRRLDVQGGAPLYRAICALSGEPGTGLDNFPISDPSDAEKVR